jgi:type I restriction enzyme S subunit
MSEWRGVSLGDACFKITDGSHQSPKHFKNGLPMFSVKDMLDRNFEYSNCKTISEEDFNILANQGCKPDIDDILIAKDGSVLKHIFRVKAEPNYVLLSSIAILKPNKKIINPDYFVYSIKNPQTSEFILSNFVSGSGVPRIVLKDFKKVEILLPGLPEQKAIAAVLSSLDNKIDLLHRQNQTLEAMADTLFRQWFVVEAREDWEEKVYWMSLN